MKAVSLLSLILVLLSSSISVAYSNAIGDELPYDHLSETRRNDLELFWKSLFSGSPKYVHTSIYEDKVWPYKTWIFGYEDCKEGVDKIIDQLNQYDVNFRSKKNKLAKSNFLKAQEVLKSNSSCLSTFQAAYLATVMMMGPVVKPEGKRLAINDMRYEQTLFVIFLSNLGVIKILDENLRKELAGSDLKSQWLEKEDNEYLITAFYDCLNSKIYIGGHLKPFNLASSLYHELDHLMRDKGGSYQFFNTTVSDDFFVGYKPKFDTDDRSIINYLAYDELLATINGGFYQRRMLNMEKDPLLNDYDHTGNEFNFFQIQGPLDRATDYIYGKLNEKDTFHIRPNAIVFALGVEDQKNNDQVARDLFCEMNQIILKGYFGYVVKDCLTYPVTYWTSGNGIADSFFDLYLERYLTYDRGQNPSHLAQVYYGKMIRLLSRFGRWQEDLLRPSLLCRKIVKAQESGELESYLGTKLMKGGRNGNGGIRPIFPCQKVHF